MHATQWISKAIFIFLIFWWSSGCKYDSSATTTAIKPDSLYVYKKPIDPNGIGKYYRGRQIAYTMGHTEASWLERAEREKEERTDLLLKALQLKPTDVVADIGAGSGYFTFRISPLVPQGKVLAVDV